MVPLFLSCNKNAVHNKTTLVSLQNCYTHTQTDRSLHNGMRRSSNRKKNEQNSKRKTQKNLEKNREDGQEDHYLPYAAAIIVELDMCVTAVELANTHADLQRVIHTHEAENMVPNKLSVTGRNKGP